MDSYCYNRLLLTGDTEKVEAAKQLFIEIEENQAAKNTYHLPEYVTTEHCLMWDICQKDDELLFKSQWAPTIEALQQIADHFQIGFVNRYEEMHSYVYGEATYEPNFLSDIRLSPTDFAAYQYDQQQHVFIYENIAYKQERDILDLLVERMKKFVLDRFARLAAIAPSYDRAILFKTESNISEEQLIALYGPLLDGHLLLKSAEHKNFSLAKEIFDQFDDHDVDEVDGYLLNNFRGMPENFDTDEKYIAHSFLQHLVNEYDKNKRQLTILPSPDYPI
jgi:hypothetical protein